MGKRRPRGKATALALVLAGAVFCAVPAVASAVPPDAPQIVSTTPASPSNNNSPFVQGLAEPLSQVSVYTTVDCSDLVPLATVFADGNGGWQTQVTVTSNQPTLLYANAANGEGPGPCSTPFTYIEDETAPGTPTLTQPVSPANNNTPKLTGTADAGSTVLVYNAANCGGSQVASGLAMTFNGGGLTVSVSDNSPNVFSVRARDDAGNLSGCSGSVTYVEDSIPPGIPTVNSTSPSSPADNNSPKVKGAAEPGSTVLVYNAAHCGGSQVASGLATTFNGGGLTVSVSDNSLTVFSVRARDDAGNLSDCSEGSVTYVEDSDAPLAPTDLTTLPLSPANESNPVFKGNAEANSMVSVFKSSNCLGPAVAMGPATNFLNGFPVNVPDDAITPLSARATDAAGHNGACASFNYTEDSTLPVAPRLLTTTPPSGSNNNDPVLRGVSDPGTTVAVFTNGTCSGHSFGGGSVAAFAAGFSFHVADNSTTHLSARATDPATNQSACSNPFDYVESSQGPGGGAVAVTASKCKKKKSKSASTAKKKKGKHCKKHKKHKKHKKK